MKTEYKQISEQFLVLASLAERIGLMRIGDEIRKYDLQKIAQDKKQLLIWGEFNHGKSTLLNAMMGREILKTGVMPTTKCLTQIFLDAPQEFVEIHDERSNEIRFEICEWEEKRAALDKEIHRIDYHLSIPELDPRLVLIDTPGSNELGKDFNRDSFRLLGSVERIVFVLDASQALKHSELALIQKFCELNLQGKLCFVVNKCDLLTHRELEDLRFYIAEKLSAFLEEPILFFLSSKSANAHEFASFKERILSFDENQEKSKADSLKAALKEKAQILHIYLQIFEATARMSDKELAKRVKSLQTVILGDAGRLDAAVESLQSQGMEIKQWCRCEILDFVRDFSNSIEREIDKASLSDVEAHLSGFVAEEFKNFADEIFSKISRFFKDFTALVFADFGAHFEEIITSLQIPSHGDEENAPLSLKIREKEGDVSTLLLGAAGVSAFFFLNTMSAGIIALSLPFFSNLLNKKNAFRAISRAKELAQEAISALGESLEKTALDAIESNRSQIQEFLQSSGSSLFANLYDGFAFFLEMGKSNRQSFDFKSQRETIIRMNENVYE